MRKQFNKKNVTKFADSLYERWPDGTTFYRPLCHGVLAKENGELVGCILGDLYEEFTGKLVARPLTKQELEDDQLIKNHLYHIEYESYDIDPVEDIKNNGLIPKICEKDIADELAKNAKLKDDMIVNDLSGEILDLAGVNDSVEGESKDARIKRAKMVQKELYKIVEKYLA